MRAKATVALGKLGRVDEAAEIWLALARDQTVEAGVLVQAVATLRKRGRATPEALAGLRALAEEPGTPKRVRRAAREALERLEK